MLLAVEFSFIVLLRNPNSIIIEKKMHEYLTTFLMSKRSRHIVSRVYFMLWNTGLTRRTSQLKLHFKSKNIMVFFVPRAFPMAKGERLGVISYPDLQRPRERILFSVRQSGIWVQEWTQWTLTRLILRLLKYKAAFAITETLRAFQTVG